MTDNVTTQEHPAFARARALEGSLKGHFPTSSEEAHNWEPIVRVHALSSKVLVVAQSRIECAWAAYCDAVPGHNHEFEWEDVLYHGSKLSEKIALVLFPEFNGVPYAY